MSISFNTVNQKWTTCALLLSARMPKSIVDTLIHLVLAAIMIHFVRATAKGVKGKYKVDGIDITERY